MKKFTPAEVEVINFTTTDIIVTSAGDLIPNTIQGATDDFNSKGGDGSGTITDNLWNL